MVVVVNVVVAVVGCYEVVTLALTFGTAKWEWVCRCLAQSHHIIAVPDLTSVTGVAIIQLLCNGTCCSVCVLAG